MNQTISPIEKIQNQFPDAVFVTPKMIASVCNVSESEIRHHCRRLFRHSGHYRFWLDGEPNRHYLTSGNLERLLRYIDQLKK